VLVEGKRDGRWFGRTRSNKLVHFAGETSVGEVVTVRIEKASAWSLQGTTAADALPLLL
jgi:tRNA-2-methylthio-N6-dimethylallyladenosine synthase